MENKIEKLTVTVNIGILILLIFGIFIQITKITEIKAQNSLLLQIVENQNKVLCDCSE